ncbi:MAG: MscL family protein [Candidatus Nanohaloarchaea archaeon]|nr:MscL family protein [Candidatus Nanohaloarchaea archaeon]
MAKDLVNAVVDDLVMPVVEWVLPTGNWETMTTSVGPVTVRTGHLLATFLDFLLVALILYLFVRHVLKKEKVEKIG